MIEQAPSFMPTQGFGFIVGDDDAPKDPNALRWYCAPGSWNDDDEKTSKNGWYKVSSTCDDQIISKLELAPPAKRDFWRKTYYQPLLIKDDGPFLYRNISDSELPVTIETSFTISAKSQFDQAGIMIRLDYEHWLKTGIEVVDGIPRLSCVVTNGFSDWSTQKVTKAEMNIRVHVLPQQGGSLVVEAAPLDSKEWDFIRIAHLNRNMNHNMLNDAPEVKDAYRGPDAPADSIMIGIFGACPVDQAGMVVEFHDLSITKGSAFVHDA